MNDFIKNNVNTIINDDNINVLKKMADQSISGIVTDVPYALCDIDALAMIKEGINNKGDFLGKKWFLPSVDFLKECHRVLKDGAFLITTFSPRQDLQCVFSYRLLEAGFDINFTPILWCFATGFPKAIDFSKMAQKRSGIEPKVVARNPNSRENCTIQNTIYESGTVGKTAYITKPTTPEAKYLDGLKSCQLKPAYEVVIIAQKPYKEKSKIDQALTWYSERKELLDKGIKEEDLYLYTKNASGGIRIDKNEMFQGAMSGRIPIENIRSEAGYRPNRTNHNTLNGKTSIMNIGGNNFNLPDLGTHSSEGRFPATILCGSKIDVLFDDLIEAHKLLNNLENKT